MLKLTTKALSLTCLKVYNFILQHHKFLNSHIVYFITNNFWSTLSVQLQNELCQLNLEEGKLLNYFLNPSEIEELKNSFPAVTKFVSDAFGHSLQKMLHDCRSSNLTEDSTLPDASRISIYNSSKHKVHKLQIKEKKQHEVEIMAELVARLVKQHDAQLVVDFGTGKGYLASLLSLLYELRVVGMESSEQNVCSAASRNEKLSLHFERELKKMNSNADSKVRKGSFVPVATTVTSLTSISDLTEKYISNCDSSDVRTVFCGLHACGNLSCTVLRHFVTCPHAAAICLLGCCYNFVEEEFEVDSDVSRSRSNTSAASRGEYGFPMSSLLREQKATIGRNARMLSMQSVERHASVIKPSRSLFFRSLLQVVLRDHLGSNLRYEVGRIPVREGTTFESYVQEALRRLNLQERVQISSETVQSYERDYAEWETKLKVYQELRILMAPSIECLLLLDRALFLLEQPTIRSCYLTRLFDPLKSPRCVAIVAKKS